MAVVLAPLYQNVDTCEQVSTKRNPVETGRFSPEPLPGTAGTRRKAQRLIRCVLHWQTARESNPTH